MKVKHRINWITLIAVLATVMLVGVGGCKKKPTAAPPPPPPPPPAPTASITANPNSIERGQSTTLSWRTENATEITIDDIGNVEASGSRSVTPTESTTYRLLAKGAGGQQEATARVTVTEAPPPPAATQATDEELFAQNVKDAFFDFDSYALRPDADQALRANVQFLSQHPNMRFTVEGHCDERGSTEYNLALGDNRANAAKQLLVQLGISADRIRTISYGKEKPFCTESNEQCWQQNRRAHFVFQR
jgi:peptidoglycan-associated lipoprotein